MTTKKEEPPFVSDERHIYVKVKLPEGYEDVHDETAFDDFVVNREADWDVRHATEEIASLRTEPERYKKVLDALYSRSFEATLYPSDIKTICEKHGVAL